MRNDIYTRIVTLKDIFQNLHDNMEVLNYIEDMYPDRFSFVNNGFLLWLWRTTMSAQLISFYIIINPTEKHSLQKVHNLLLNSGEKLNYLKLTELINNITKEYQERKFEVVRSQFLAHKDIIPQVIRTDVQSIIKLSKDLIDAYIFLRSELNLPDAMFTNKVKLDIRKVISKIE